MIDATIRAYATRQLAAAALAAGLALSLALWSHLQAGPLSNLPTAISGPAKIVDGDTIDVQGTRVRLEGIDAPETSQTCGRATTGTWKCGLAAAAELARLLAGQPVRCESRGTDTYGRMLGVCFVGPLDVNAEMVQRGLAWAFVKYSTVYQHAEADARARKAGVWQGDAQPPWEYRHARWSSAENAAPAGCAIKGNVTANGRIYHMPWSPWYDRISMRADKGERWFCTEDEAVAAGWRPVRIH